MPIGWRPQTSKLEELIAEEQAKIEAIRGRREWLDEPLISPVQPSSAPALPERTPLPLPEDYIPPQLPSRGKVITDDYIPPQLPQVAKQTVEREYTPPQLPTTTTETPLWQKGLQTFTAPFNWISENITEPFGAVVTSPFTSPEGLTRQPNESWLDFEKRQYERLNPVLKFGVESVPWFLIPGAGQVGTAARAGTGIAGALGKAGRVGKVLGKAVELSPWGLTEKATGKVISTVLRRRAIPTLASITPRVGEVLQAQMMREKAFVKGIADGLESVSKGDVTYGEFRHFLEKLKIPLKEDSVWVNAQPELKGLEIRMGEHGGAEGFWWETLGSDIKGMITDLLAKRKLDAIDIARYRGMLANADANIDTAALVRSGEMSFRGDILKTISIPAKEVDPVVTKFTRLIREFKPATGMTLKLQHEARQQQAAKIADIFATQQPSVAFKMAKGALKGTLPEAVSPAFEQMTAKEITSLQGMIQNFPQWERLPFNKVATEDAFQGLLHGIIPTRSETGLLETVFGSEMVKAILAKRSLGRKAFDLTMDAAGIPKALVSAFDISFPARQGILLIGEKSWWTSWKPMMKALLSDKNASTIEANIAARPLAQYDKTIGLDITVWNRVSAGLEKFEESFPSRLANWFPWVRASNRAFTTFGNKLRTDTSDYYLGRWLKEMPEAEALDKAKRLASFINKGTGRGNLGSLARSGEAQQILNATFFSPKFVMGRIQTPFTLFEKDPTVRKVIAKDLAIFLGSGMTALTLAKLGGAEVELDPRSTDFGKVRIGKTRIDFWGGFQPMARYMAQFVTEERKSVSGAVTPVERLDVAGRFVESKLSPTAGLILDALRGQNFIGEPVELTGEAVGREAYQKLVPMFLQDLRDATIEQGLIGTGLALPSAIGASVTTYPVEDPRDEMAQRTYGKPFEELSPAQKGEIRNLPEVRARLRPTESEKESYRLYDQQLEDDQAFRLGTLTNEQWRDRMYDRLAIRSYARKQWEGKYPEPSTPEEMAQAGYYAIFEKLGENAMPDEVKTAMREAEQYLATLPPELADYVEENRWSNSTPLMKEFKQAQKVLRPYWAVADQVARLFGQRFADSPAGKSLIAKRKKQMRLSNREVAQAYNRFYSSK